MSVSGKLVELLGSAPLSPIVLSFIDCLFLCSAAAAADQTSGGRPDLSLSLSLSQLLLLLHSCCLPLILFNLGDYPKTNCLGPGQTSHPPPSIQYRTWDAARSPPFFSAFSLSLSSDTKASQTRPACCESCPFNNHAPEKPTEAFWALPCNHIRGSIQSGFVLNGPKHPLPRKASFLLSSPPIPYPAQPSLSSFSIHSPTYQSHQT